MNKISQRDFDNSFIPGKEKMLIDKINELINKVHQLEALIEKLEAELL